MRVRKGKKGAKSSTGLTSIGIVDYTCIDFGGRLMREAHEGSSIQKDYIRRN